MSTVIGYVRVSTLEQAEDGVSLDAQRERIAAWCRQNGHSGPVFHADEGLSGKRADNRPALQAALRAVCANGGVLVVYSLSRLCRSTRDALDIAERLKKAGADLVSITEQIDTTTAMGEFFFTVMAALGQLERRLIGERTREALAHKRANGEKTGGHLPYGTKLANGKLVENKDEQEAIEMMAALRDSNLSYQDIADAMNARGIPTRTGRPWTGKTVRDICKRHASATS